jgi:hypothetical protein
VTTSAARPSTLRLLADCPHCGKRLAPDWCGLWTRTLGPRRRCETHVAYCPLCDVVWVVRASAPWRAWGAGISQASVLTDPRARVTLPRKGTAIEKRLALKWLFTRRGAAVPSE